jgi:hypothetical protein
MQEASIEITFEPRKTGTTKGQLLVQYNGEVIHSDVIDMAKDKDLTAFLKKLKKHCPAIDTEHVRRLILAEVARISNEKTNAAELATEVEAMRVVRPHLFHLPQVSGLLVPVVRPSDSGPKGHWLLHIQWADGKRECRDLEQYLTLPDNERIWFAPMPSSPAVSGVFGWSAQGRKKWLDGYTPQADSLFKDLAKTINHYLEFPVEEAPGHLATLSLWVILTYAYPAWLAVPYLSIGGPLGSGKSRVFDVLNKLVLRPLGSSNMTAACLFRTLHAQGGTLLLDEAERLRDRSTESSEMLSILLGGYKAGGKAHRLEKQGDSFRLVAFDVYGPKAIAGISELPPALTSRCIRITMFKAGKSSPKPARRVDQDPERWKQLADDLHSFALAGGQQFIKAAQNIILCEGLSGRDMEVWQPILALAQMVQDAGACGLVELVKQHARDAVAKVKIETIPETDEILMRSLIKLLDYNLHGVTANQVLEKANDEDPASFHRYTPRGVGAVLRRYGLKSQPIGGKRLFRPDEEKLRAIQEAYGIDLAPNPVECADKGSW